MGRPKKEHIFIDGIELKICSTCQIPRELDMFPLRKTKWDGLHQQCKKCTKKYRDNNKHISKNYRKNNKEQIRLKNKHYRNQNKEKINIKKK